MIIIKEENSTKHYRKVVNLEYNRIGSYPDMNPFATSFCRTEKQGNVLVTGGINDVEDYIRKFLGNCLVTTSYWNHGEHRSASPKLYGPIARGLHILNVTGKGKLSHLTKGIVSEAYGIEATKNWIIIKKYTGTKYYELVAEWNKIPSSYPRDLKDGRIHYLEIPS